MLTAAMVACGVTGCSKSAEERDCTDAEVQTIARKLLVLKMADWARPLAPHEEWVRNSLDQADPAVAAARNAIRVQRISPDTVRLDQIQQVSSPSTATGQAEPGGKRNMSGNTPLYGCTAVAHIQIPGGAQAASPAVAVLAGMDQNDIRTEIVYETERTAGGSMVVAVGFANPLAEMALRALLTRKP